MKQLSKFLSLGSRDRQLLAYTFMVLGLVRLGLGLLRYTTLQKLLKHLSQPIHPSLSTTPAAPLPIERLIWAVEVSTAYTRGSAKCLARALTAQVLMKQQGYSPQLQIGVAKSAEGKMQAHAWIEYQGHVIIGDLPNLASFRELLPAHTQHTKIELGQNS